MNIIINSSKTDVTANNANEYLAACRKIDVAIERNRNISVASDNRAVIGWLLTMYEGRCTIIIKG